MTSRADIVRVLPQPDQRGVGIINGRSRNRGWRGINDACNACRHCGFFLLAGIEIHFAGMVIAHRADAKAMIAPTGWHQALTIACWIALIGLAALATFLFIPSPR